MKVSEKIKLIQKMSGLTQAELASRLGVTFAALNRWVNKKSIPRKSSQEKIDSLYRDYSGEKEIPETVLEAKKNFILRKRKLYPYVLERILKNSDIQDEFYLALTYNSNRIEGSTLSENETATVLFEGLALPNKSFKEQLEAKNHQVALDYLFNYLRKNKRITQKLILKLHAILLNAIHPESGSYRTSGVRILGANVPTANYVKIPQLMDELVKNINKDSNDEISDIAKIHSRFEQIHPFADGNGRIGRLIMHAMALRDSLSPVVILQERRRLYLTYLNKSQIKEDFSLLEDFIGDAILEGYKILEKNYEEN